MSSDSEHSSFWDSPDNFVHLLPSAYPWVDDSAFGVVHPLGCKACRHYMSHIVDARQSLDVSFDHAVKERDGKADVRYLDGVREGRRLQRSDDRERLSRYKSQRNAALELSAQYKATMVELQAELCETRDRLLALQVAFDEMGQFNPPFILGGGDESNNALHFMEWQTILFGSSADRTTNSQQQRSQDSSVSTLEEESDPTDSLHLGESLESPQRQDLRDLAVDSDSEISSESSFSDSSESPDCSPLSTSSESLPEIISPSNSIISHSSDLEHLQLMMSEAHVAGNSKQLAEIRALCSCAHRTPRGQRTDLQKYLLNTWRSPSSSAEQLPLPHSFHDKLNTAVASKHFSSEIFVDASSTGIGLVTTGGMWLSWKLKADWKKDGRDIIWAEMAAVELGLRAMVTAGCRSTTIVLRSDNSSVVRALHSQSSKNSQENAILQEILDLCRAHDIKIIPRWISTKDNPADGPSRGICPPASLLFQASPSLPSHLVQYIQE